MIYFLNLFLNDNYLSKDIMIIFNCYSIQLWSKIELKKTYYQLLIKEIYNHKQNYEYII